MNELFVLRTINEFEVATFLTTKTKQMKTAIELKETPRLARS